MLMTWFNRALASGISFSAMSASFDSMLKRSSAFCKSPVSLRSSPNIPGSRMCTMWSIAAKKATSSSVLKASFRASTQVLYSSFRMAKFDMLFSLAGAQDLVQLFLQGLRREGLDDITVHASLRCLDDLLPLGFRSQHQHGHFRQLAVGAYGLDQIEAGHHGHVPDGDEKVEPAGLEHGQGGLAVVGFLHVRVTEVVQQILDDAAHGREVIDHEELKIFAHSRLTRIRMRFYATVALICQSRLQTHARLALQLAGARFRNFQHRTDLFQGQPVGVVQRHDLPFPLRQAVDRLRECFFV